jgi:hypothetical protein
MVGCGKFGGVGIFEGSVDHEEVVYGAWELNARYYWA